MKKIYVIFSVFTIIVVLSCNSFKGSNAHTHESQDMHYHGANSHSHSKKKEVKLSGYFGDYSLNDENFGTKTTVIVNDKTRKMVTNALPNHKTGEYPRKGNPNTISAQKRTYSFPVNPKFTGNPKWVREPGVALNGVKFEPGTAEVVACDTGENYRVEAFQELINLGLDFNNAHVQPTGAYHYHGAPTSVIEKFDSGNDLVHIGFAHDGFPMYFSKIGAYKPSYELIGGSRKGEACTYETRRNVRDISVDGHHDGTYTSDYEYVDGLGDLDECNGIAIDGKYMYLVTNEFPYVSRCLMGEVIQEERKGRLTITQLFERMNSNNDEKISKAEIRGPLASQFSKIDNNNDGFLVQSELENMSRLNRIQRRRE
ncbi:YHYH protein [uncultured Algibacter sp.]|uniref:YHYH protein n=1 Tax=uncultured Algibacter sp. TaxID=298659 RepID=UPI00260E8BDC|nr:YHYH protein [uncultured Algibacter sp.]